MAEPIWRDENTGEPVNVNDNNPENTNTYNILTSALTYKSNDSSTLFYQYITDGSSLYIEPNTYYYYVGMHPSSIIKPNLYPYMNIPPNPAKLPQVNRIYQAFPKPRYIMLTNNFIKGTLNPITTQPIPTQQPYPKITIISNALESNNANLYDQRFNIINTQETLTTLTNRLNNLKLKLAGLKQKPMYSASGNLTFY